MPSKKSEILKRYKDEGEFLNEVLAPLLRKMGKEGVDVRHGSHEYGKDIVFYEKTDLGIEYCVAIVKLGQIGLTAGGTHHLNSVRDQIRTAFKVPYPDLANLGHRRINKIYVWATGNISYQAQVEILDSASDFHNIHFIDGQRTIELLEQYLPNVFAIEDPRISDYFHTSKQHYSRIEELRTLGASDEGHSLASLYVEPGIRSYWRMQEKQTRRHKKQECFAKLVESGKSFVLVGTVGSGKTTLLRRALIQIIEANEANASRVPIPIIVEFKRIDLESDSPIIDEAKQQFRHFCSIGKEYSIIDDLENGNIVLLLDGLDELQEENRIEDALKAVIQLQQRFPATQLVIASRDLDLFEKPDIVSDLTVYEIESLSPKQIQSFLCNWYSDNVPEGRRLYKLLVDTAVLHGLPTTPLTLAIVANLHDRGQEIPASLTELMDKYVELALGRWDTERDIRLEIDWAIKRFFLKRISWNLQEQRRDSIGLEEFKDEVTSCITARGLEGIDTDTLLREIVYRSELLYKNVEGEYEFKHRLFQEYFAGLELAQHPDFYNRIVTQFLDPWWVYTIFFACGCKYESGDHLIEITSGVPVTRGTSLPFALNLGLVLQATYLAPREIKKKTMYKVIEHLALAWNNLCDLYEQLEEKPRFLVNNSPHILFAGAYGFLASTALGSITLASTIRDIADELSVDSWEIDDPDERYAHEWRAFLVACAALEVDEVESLERLVSSRALSDTAFMLSLEFQLKDYIKFSDWLSEDKLTLAKGLLKNISKKVKKASEYKRKMRSKSPVPIRSLGRSTQRALGDHEDYVQSTLFDS